MKTKNQWLTCDLMRDLIKYREYLKKHGIKYRQREDNGKIYLVFDQKYKPFRWKIFTGPSEE